MNLKLAIDSGIPGIGVSGDTSVRMVHFVMPLPPSKKPDNQSPSERTMKIEIKAAPPPPVSKAQPKFSTLMDQGRHLAQSGSHQDAVSIYNQAIALNPANADAYYGRGYSLRRLGQLQEALASYAESIRLKPDARAFLNRGNILRELRNFPEAIANYDSAIQLQPATADAHNGKGVALAALGRQSEALQAYTNALAVHPQHVLSFINRGNLLREMKRLPEALADYDQAFMLKPATEFLEGIRQHTRMQLCDWKNYAEATASLADKAGKGLPVSASFPLVALPSTAQQQLACAQIFTQRQYPPRTPLWRGEIYKHTKIKLAYLSSDFYEHATSYLLAGVLECHDRSRFELIALSSGPDDRSHMRERVKKSFDTFLDIRTMSDEDAARLVKKHEVDILLDLKGHTQNNRTHILAQRPAPVQINYLGYPGTMGAPYIDYIVADKVLVPEDMQSAYSEKIIYLPHSYQPNDKNRPLSAQVPTRAMCGLPEQGFVFCAFNLNYKFTPDVFDVWMRLLKAVDKSVLWLMEPSADAAKNLVNEAAARGVPRERIVFAKYAKLPDHLARYAHADLFLDNLPCNAHTTASDALWKGVPVITCQGNTFAGRVASSLLTATGMPELITTSLEEYEALALSLARNPDRLSSVKQKLAANRDTCALFNTAQYTRDLEAALLKTVERARSGQPSAAIY